MTENQAQGYKGGTGPQACMCLRESKRRAQQEWEMGAGGAEPAL